MWDPVIVYITMRILFKYIYFISVTLFYRFIYYKSGHEKYIKNTMLSHVTLLIIIIYTNARARTI
jgi:hypothetical protein